MTRPRKWRWWNRSPAEDFLLLSDTRLGLGNWRRWQAKKSRAKEKLRHIVNWDITSIIRIQVQNCRLLISQFFLTTFSPTAKIFPIYIKSHKLTKRNVCVYWTHTLFWQDTLMCEIRLFHLVLKYIVWPTSPFHRAKFLAFLQVRDYGYHFWSSPYKYVFYFV